MNERLKEFYKKIHDSKGSTPQYISIIIRPGKNLIDFKIKKEGGESNILKIIAHDEKASGWFVHSYHIPFNNLGIPSETKSKEVLALLNDPRKIQ